MSYNSDQVSKSLKLFNSILNKHKIKHVYFGLIIPAAINGSLHRNLGDFDIFIDVKKNDLFIRELKKNGYITVTSGAFGKLLKGLTYLIIATQSYLK